MKQLLGVIILCLSSAALTWAQAVKKTEFFAGYSYENLSTGVTSADLGTPTTLDNRFNLNGFNVSGATYFSRHIGVAGDFSGHYDGRNDLTNGISSRTKFSLYDITGGPQFRLPTTTRFTPFVHALFGVAHRDLTETLNSGTSFGDSNTSFAMNFGGGIDYKLNDRFDVRLGQFDYNPIFLGNRSVNSVPFPGRTQNGFRFSTGIVIK